MSNKKEAPALGCGLDIGTMNIVSARETNGDVVTKAIRDSFLDLESDAKRSLKMSGVDYFEKKEEGLIYVLGDGALTMANLFKREVRRPLSKGVISAGELDAQEILSRLIENVVGPTRELGEHCFYSVPAEPIDVPGQDVVYHTEVFRKILKELGYQGHPTNEAMAIIFSQCIDDKFSGLSVSYGSGMCNVALAYQASAGMVFSVARGGDWIDQHSAKAVGKTASQMCTVKERGVNLSSPEGRDQQAIALYIRNLIEYTLKAITAEFKKVANDVNLPEPIPFIVSGGTTKAGGFMALFEEEFEKVRKKFPIQISEVRHAKNPLTAVAEGLLILAQEEHENV
jgi:actin-like ATPase involved in cell morphogenesis